MADMSDDVDAIDWARLRACYGTAEQVPRLLAAAVGVVGDHEVWDDLLEPLYHQGTVYPASYAAVPALASLTIAHPPARLSWPLQLLASIIASNDGPGGIEDVRRANAPALAQCAQIAERDLSAAESDIDFVYILQALAAFEDIPVWQRDLERLSDDEAEFDCPRCGECVLVSFGGDGIHASVAHADARGFVPAAPADLGLGEQRLYDLAVTHGRTEVARGLLCFFGQVTCPECESLVVLREAMEG